MNQRKLLIEQYQGISEDESELNQHATNDQKEARAKSSFPCSCLRGSKGVQARAMETKGAQVQVPYARRKIKMKMFMLLIINATFDAG